MAAPRKAQQVIDEAIEEAFSAVGDEDPERLWRAVAATLGNRLRIQEWILHELMNDPRARAALETLYADVQDEKSRRSASFDAIPVTELSDG